MGCIGVYRGVQSGESSGAESGTCKRDGVLLPVVLLL